MREIGIDRPRFDVKVSNEVFTLYFIPNLARKKYIDFWQRVEQMMEALKISNKKERKQAVDALSTDDESDILKPWTQFVYEFGNLMSKATWSNKNNINFFCITWQRCDHLIKWQIVGVVN